MKACRSRWAAAAVLVLCAAPWRAWAQDVSPWLGRPVSDVRIVSAGRVVQDEQLTSLLDIHRGDPLSMKEVRATIQHIMGMRRYSDVRVEAAADGDGVRVDVVLIPLRDLRRIVFRGSLGLPESALRNAIAERFGDAPAIGRAIDLAQTLRALYESEGYLQAVVRMAPLDDVGTDAGGLVFEITAGARASVRAIEFRGSPAAVVETLRKRLDVQPGSAYEPAVLKRRLDAFAAGLRKERYFQARAASAPVVTTASRDAVDLVVTVTRGPLVSVEFKGYDLPPAARADLVPIEREGSVDQDLLEDSERRIQQHLTARGYRDATAVATVGESDDRLNVEFTITRGPLYRVAGDVAIKGAENVPEGELRPLIKIARGQPFVLEQLDTDKAALKKAYLQKGYADVSVTSDQVVSGSDAAERAVSITVTISEGPLMTVRSISFAGRSQVPESVLLPVMSQKVDKPYYQPTIEADRDRLETEYLNLGFRRVHVRVEPPPADSGPDVHVRFLIQEGPKVIVDRILVVGNARISEATIRRELEIESGAPLGDEKVRQSQRKLAALGLFRRITISELQHGQEARSDVLVTVEEAPATTIGYGGGVEFQKVETNEFAPRAFFEVGRRNLWGKNRSINLFSRVSFRHHATSDTNSQFQPVTVSLTNLDYRIIGAYREPRFLDTRADLQVSAVFEQGSLTSFRYKRRSARVDLGRRLSGGWRVLGQYSFERNTIFEDQINPIDRPLIDRLFPQVRLSILSATTVRDTRDDPLDPGAGNLISLSGDLALRAIGSEVGLAKAFTQAFVYRQLPTSRRIVVAAGARLGMGTGFRRSVQVVDGNGQPVLGPDGQPLYVSVRDLPANERFFAGGDTSVRGFQLDRLGRPDTFDRDGVPIGGHAEVILNGEVRMAVWRNLGVVGFLDLGNVFSSVTAVDLRYLRGAAGFGIRYKSPVGPLRVDLGFKLGGLQTFGTYAEHRLALHISIGQAF